MSQGMDGRIAMVTGGGGFLGTGIAGRLAEAGAKVAVVDISLESAERTAAAITKAGGSATAFAADVADIGSVRACVASIASRLGAPDILVNCAGGSARKRMAPFHKLDIEVLDGVLGMNLRGTLYCIRETIGPMIAKKYGKVVNLTSIIALGGKEQCVDYAAAKGGIIAATRSLALELGRHNITVNCLSLGKVQRPDERPADEAAFARRYSCLNRLCTRGDVAGLALFLAGPESDFITGQNYVLDGGRSLGLKGDYEA